MTEEIERLRAEWKNAKAAVQEAELESNKAEATLNEALIEWAKADLSVRGISIMGTPVNGGHKTYSGDVSWNNLYVAVVSHISARHGVARYHLTKLTKTGKVSNGYDADLGAFAAVKIAETRK